MNARWGMNHLLNGVSLLSFAPVYIVLQDSVQKVESY